MPAAPPLSAHSRDTPASPGRLGRRLLFLLLAGAALLLLVSIHAEASHYRYGTLSWERTGTANEARFYGVQAWRASAFASPAVGSIVAVGGSLDFGDGSASTTLYVNVTFIDTAKDWFKGNVVDSAGNAITHAYASPTNGGTPWLASWGSCCRLSPGAPRNHVNNPDKSERMEVDVDLTGSNRSPNSTLWPFQLCPVSSVCTFSTSFTDPDGNALSYSLATTAQVMQAGTGTFVQPGPPDAPNAATVNPVTGLVTWNTAGATAPAGMDNYYSMAVAANDGKVDVVVDFLICLVPASNSGCPVPPPDFTWSARYCVGSRVQFSATPPSGFTATSARWAWGDSSADTTGPWGTTATPTHQFPAAGSYNVQLTLDYTSGLTSSRTRAVTVGDCPQPDFSWTPGTYCTGTRLTFTATPAANYTAESARWQWGDGSPDTTVGPPWSPTAEHRFMAPGTYYVTLTVTSTDGSRSSKVHDVVLGACPPPDFTWTTGAQCNSLRSFTATPAAGQTPSSALWEWGDGTSTTVGPPWSASASHEFASSAHYPVRLTVTNQDGSFSSRTRIVDVDGCHRTYAAGDLAWDNSPFGPETFFVVGDDPGCGLGDAGSQLQGHPQTTVSYDIYTGAWHQEVPPPFEWFLQGAVAQPFGLFSNGGLLVAGGTHDCSFVPAADAQIYDTQAWPHRWTATAPLQQARIAPAAAGSRDGFTHAFFAGGDVTGGSPHFPGNPHIPTPTVEMYMPWGDWWYVEPMPAGVIGAPGAIEGKPGGGSDFVVSGGYSHPQSTNALVQTMDAFSHQWAGPHLPAPVYLTDHQGVVCNGRRWVLGGLQHEQAPMHDFVPQIVTAAVWSESANSGTGAANWVSGTPMPLPLAFHQAATVDTLAGSYIYVYGGNTNAGNLAPMSNTLFRMECPTTGTGGGFQVLNPVTPNLQPPPPVAEGALETTHGVLGPLPLPSLVPPLPSALLPQELYLFGGTNSLGNGPGGPSLGSCPTNAVYGIDPLTNLFVTLGVQIPVPVASMGSAVLPDGRILLAGGRVDGFNAWGNPTCHKPTDRVFVFDPVQLSFCEGPRLPHAVIGPAVAAVGWTVYVAGGDDRGDVPVPTLGTDDRPRHPHNHTYSLNALGVCVSPLNAWVDLGEMPMGVVHGQLVPLDGLPWLIAGNHHPIAAVRLVQAMDAAGNWMTPMLRQGRAHHGMESCQSILFPLMVYGGAHRGTVYHSEPGLTDMQDDILRGSGSSWTSPSTIRVPGERMFPVGSSSDSTNQPPSFIATGTTPSLHRVKDPSTIC